MRVHVHVCTGAKVCVWLHRDTGVCMCMCMSALDAAPGHRCVHVHVFEGVCGSLCVFEFMFVRSEAWLFVL